MPEPGLTLGRLIAAERNALAGVEVSRRAESDVAALTQRVSRLELEVVQLKEAMARLNARVYSMMGSGATN